MKKYFICSILLCFITAVGILASNSRRENIATITQVPGSPAEAKQDILCLMLAYPEHISGLEKGSDGNVYVLLKSGKKLIYDDHKIKTPAGKLGNPDLQDTLEQIYPLSDVKTLMPEDFDPGRARVYPLLKEVYGVSEKQIYGNLSTVKCRYQNYSFNQNNKAAQALQAVMNELEALAESRKDIRACAFPASGTYNYRLISGTNQLSAHAFGISIDLATDKRDYWKWSSRKEGEKRLATYPVEIVRIFEKNNFIWGGKWGHFDIMHFEYRPEIILKARYFGQNSEASGNWFDGTPTGQENITQYIQRIDEVIR